MIDKDRVKVIFFDAGGVLFETKIRRPDRIRRILKSKGIEDSIITEGLKKAETYTQELIEGGKLIASWQDEKIYWSKYFDILTRDIQNKDLYLNEQLYHSIHYFHHCVLFPETKEMLEVLKEKYRLAVISNALPSMDWVFDLLELRKYFEKIIISAFVGIHKPDEKIYQEALKQMKIEPQYCLFIDDKEENIKAAQSLGMQGIHLKREENSNTSDLNFLRHFLL